MQNVRSALARHEGWNQVVERLNGTFQESEKVMREMDYKESAQKLIDAYRIHHNFKLSKNSAKTQ